MSSDAQRQSSVRLMKTVEKRHNQRGLRLSIRATRHTPHSLLVIAQRCFIHVAVMPATPFVPTAPRRSVARPQLTNVAVHVTTQRLP
jgi:hypothetical protein